ncbi:hypothetical protein BOTBODRAFT_58983 [Botryobasidium botryosum FD-172 SS1]|uniref:Uncharacterized protein n=1 Tax=Botryobasidium botryosum (strain FD-172 SS1) TaxID=930990 RepID=A0A067MBG0_BOTB1|nr:hypothetical protein BOTBODRAFT_58983 [Botryobasidium botryosum FD-172 SS1]
MGFILRAQGAKDRDIPRSFWSHRPFVLVRAEVPFAAGDTSLEMHRNAGSLQDDLSNRCQVPTTHVARSCSLERRPYLDCSQALVGAAPPRNRITYLDYSHPTGLNYARAPRYSLSSVSLYPLPCSHFSSPPRYLALAAPCPLSRFPLVLRPATPVVRRHNPVALGSHTLIPYSP